MFRLFPVCIIKSVENSYIYLKTAPKVFDGNSYYSQRLIKIENHCPIMDIQMFGHDALQLLFTSLTKKTDQCITALTLS